MSQQTLAGPDAIGAKKRDYWWTVLFTDPFALRGVRFLTRRRWISPDGLSVVAATLGLLVGPVFAIGTRWALVAGALLFQLAFIADCMDGKLARALGTGTARGIALDKVGDAFRRASAAAGLIVYLWRGEDAVADSPLFGVVYVLLAYFFLEISGGSEVRQEAWFKKDGTGGGHEPRRLSAALARRRLMPTPGMPDVQAIAFIIGPLTGFVEVALVVAASMLVAGILINLWRLFRVGGS